MEYFSDKERGPTPRVHEVISPSAWGGIVALVRSLISTGTFGYRFPETCPDGAGPVGTDENALALAVKAEIPDLTWPLQTATRAPGGFSWDEEPYAPDTLVILDFVEFCYQTVAKPVQLGYHKFFQHYHLSYDPEAGKQEFQDNINRIFARNGIAYELNPDGAVVRLAPAVLGESLTKVLFRTGDATLDQLLEESRRKFLNPDPAIRREAVERLWDAWERVKSLEDPKDKKRSISTLLDKAATESNFRLLLEEEARKLTDIGNSFHIRHTEVTQTQVTDSAHIDYLFHRLFSMVQLLLSKRGRNP